MHKKIRKTLELKTKDCINLNIHKNTTFRKSSTENKEDIFRHFHKNYKQHADQSIDVVHHTEVELDVKQME